MNPVGYQSLTSRKDSGAHYTPKKLADFVASVISDHVAAENTNIKVLDPSVGDGELLLALGSALEAKGKTVLLQGFDIDEQAVNASLKKIKKQLPATKYEIETLDFLDDIALNTDNSLFTAETRRIPEVDVVIANPPYIRTQVLGSLKAQRLAKKYGITGRLDIYQAFVAHIHDVLSIGGLVGIILSNRFMYTQGGKSTREFLMDKFDILGIWDLGDTKVFEAAVLPVVLLLRKKSPLAQINSAAIPFTSIYEVGDSAEATDYESIFDGLDYPGIISVDGKSFNVKQGKLSYEDGGPWRLSAVATDLWLSKVEKNTFCTFGEVSKVKVGVKTTADKVFIRGIDWLDEVDHPETVLPLATHHIAKRYAPQPPKYSILYTHISDSNGKKSVIKLDENPNAAKYLYKHRDRLESRKYVIDAGREWYEIWVPHNPSDWSKPKIIFKDISEKPTFWLELEDVVVNGDCYWMAIPDKQESLAWLLLAIANSSFIEEFYDHKFNNKLYSGRRRYITQYVTKFPVLNPEDESSKAIIKLSKSIYEKVLKQENIDALEIELDHKVRKAFGVS